MLRHYIRKHRIRLPYLAIGFPFIAVPFIYFLMLRSRSENWPSDTSMQTLGTTFSDGADNSQFKTYVNYTGPLPIPGPMGNPTFRYHLNEQDVCSQKRHPDMRILLYVHSAPWHSQLRNFIRRTWASPKFYPRFKMATLFFLGMPPNGTMQKSIEDESEKFGDIIQVDFEDSYYKLTYKSVSALAWISRYCRNAEFVVKTDDDVFVNIFQLVKLLFNNNSEIENAVHCSVYADAAPHRNPKSKWYISPEEYPWKKYPNFCAGMAVFYPGRLVPRLFEAITDVPYLKLDDVYVTGLLRHRAGIGLHDIGSTVNNFYPHNCLQKNLKRELFCHAVKRKWELWMKLLVAEVTELTIKNHKYVASYAAALHNILTKDFEELE